MVVTVLHALAELDAHDLHPPEAGRVVLLDAVEAVNHAAAHAAIVHAYRDFVLVVVPAHQALPQLNDLVCGGHCVLAVPLFVEVNLLVHPVAYDGLIVAEAGHVAPDLDAQRVFPGHILGLDAPLNEVDGNKDIILLQGELPVHADAHDVALPAVSALQHLDILLVGAGHITGGHAAGAVKWTNLGVDVAVVEGAAGLGGVPAHEQFVVLPGEGAQHRFHDGLGDAAGLVDDEQHIFLMETLHILRLGGRPGHGKPAFLHAHHVDIGLCPFENNGEERALGLPLGDLRPEHVVELLTGGRGGYHAGIWEAGQEPQHHDGLHGRLAHALPGTDAHPAAGGVCQVEHGICLPLVGLVAHDFLGEQYGVYLVDRLFLLERFNHLRHLHRRLPPPPRSGRRSRRQQVCSAPSGRPAAFSPGQGAHAAL